MKLYQIFFGIFLSMGIAMSAEYTFEAVYAGSSRTEHILNATFAQGSSRGSSETPSVSSFFEDDLVSHNGILGLRVGPGQASIDYVTKRNLPETEGVITFQFENFDQIKNSHQKWNIFHINNSEGLNGLQLFHNIEGGLSLIGRDIKGVPYSIATKVIATDDTDKFEISIRYTRTQIKLFINGQEAGDAPWNGAPQWAKTMRIGDSEGSQEACALLLAWRISVHTPQASYSENPLAGAPTPWWDAGRPKLGLDALDPDYVPEPWSPILWKNGELEVWGRTYNFNNQSLLKQVTATGHPLLNASIELVTSAGPILFEAPALVDQHHGKVVLQRVGKNENLQISMKITIEYDGMVWFELEGLPNAKSSYKELTLRIPFRAEASRYLHYIGAPYKYESQNLSWNSGADKLPEPEMTRTFGFKTYFWIGNAERGLQWFAESEEGWWPLDRTDSIRVQRHKDGGSTLELAIQTKPYPDNENHMFSLRFGLMATPVKPMPEGWRGWTLSAQYGSPSDKNRANHLIYWPDEWRTMSLDPEPHRATEKGIQLTREKVAQDHKAGRLILPYWTRIHAVISDAHFSNPDGTKMAELWEVDPDHVRGGKLDLRRVSMDTEWSDYLVWCFEEWGKVFGHINGLYLDETQPIPNRREASNGGYVTPMGERRATFEFRGSRDYIKRINYLGERRLGHSPTTIIHNSSTYAMPYMSSFSIFLPGEHLNSGYFKLSDPDILPSEEERSQGYYYCHVLPMEQLIAEGYWKQWGVPIAWLPQLKNQKDIMNSPVAARDLLSRLQQVDTLLWPLFMNQEEVAKTIQFRKDFGIERNEVVFIPAWENKQIIADKENVWVGFYRQPGKILAIVSNLNREPVSTSLSFKGIAPQAIRNAETRQLLPLRDDKIHLSVPRNDYVALIIHEDSPNEKKKLTTNNKNS